MSSSTPIVMHVDRQVTEDRDFIRDILDRSNDSSTLLQLFEKSCSTRERREKVARLRGSEAEKFLTLLQEVLHVDGHGTLLAGSRAVFIQVLTELARVSGCFPSTVCLSDVNLEPDVIDGGGFGDIHKGHWNCDGKVVTVAVKVPRYFTGQSNSPMEKQFYQEALLWHQISHKHILPFLGIYKYGPRLAIVSEFQKNGNLTHYLRQNPNSDKYKLLMDATSGLVYLHKNGVVHRDLKGPNILIGDDHRAMLADFGLSRMQHDLSEFLSSTKDVGTRAYMSPELVEYGSSKATRSSDIWALGMVIYEAFARETPFSNMREIPMITAIREGSLPKKPEFSTISGFTDDLWQFLKESCWKRNPDHRPSASDCLRRLEHLSRRQAAIRAASSPGLKETRMPVERKYTGSLPLETFRQQGVKVELYQGFISLRGACNAVDAVELDIHKYLESRANQTRDNQLIIPPRLHKLFIGPQGDTIKKFEERYSVKVSFDQSGAVSVSGSLIKVTQAKEELQRILTYHELYDDIRHVKVQPDTIVRVRSDQETILLQTGLKSITPTTRDVSDILELRGSKTALDKGEKLINKLQEQLNREITVDLDCNVLQIREHIVGDKLAELMAQCGGPEDRKIQRRVVSYLPGPRNIIRLRGDPSLVQNFQQVLADEVERSREIVIGIVIPHRMHSILRKAWHSCQYPQQTRTLAHFPGTSNEQPAFVDKDPENLSELNDKDTRDVIRICGTRENCEQARKLLNKLSRAQKKEIELKINLPRKYHHDVFNIVEKNLTFKELKISINFIDPPPVPLRPMITPGTTWKVFPRYDPEDHEKIAWYVNAPTEDATNKAREIIKKVAEEVGAASRIGLLSFPNSLHFGLIVGSGGETLRRIQAETNTSIEIPKPGDGSTITIIGSEVNVEVAKDLILQIRGRALPRRTSS